MSGSERTDKDKTALFVAYATGTASKVDRAEVEAVTRDDPRAASRLKLVMASREALAKITARERDEWSPGEVGRRRLLREIERESAKARAAWIESVVLWRGIAAAAILAFALIGLGRDDGAQNGDGSGYKLATRSGDANAIAQIAFSPNANEAEIRALLFETGATFIDGPSALGIYRVSFENAKARDAGVTQMKTALAVESVSAD